MEMDIFFLIRRRGVVSVEFKISASKRLPQRCDSLIRIRACSCVYIVCSLCEDIFITIPNASLSSPNLASETPILDFPSTDTIHSSSSSPQAIPILFSSTFYLSYHHLDAAPRTLLHQTPSSTSPLHALDLHCCDSLVFVVFGLPEIAYCDPSLGSRSLLLPSTHPRSGGGRRR
jgi:hypothetical protein